MSGSILMEPEVPVLAAKGLLKMLGFTAPLDLSRPPPAEQALPAQTAYSSVLLTSEDGLDTALRGAAASVARGAVLALPVAPELMDIAQRRLAPLCVRVQQHQAVNVVLAIWRGPDGTRNIRPDIAGRLLERETSWFRGRQRISELERQLGEARSAGGGGSASAYGLPADRPGWPRRDQPGRPVSGLGLYDHRPEDAVLDEAQRGRAFLSRFGLEDDGTPDFAAAVEALNAAPRHTALSSSPLDPVPDVSIVIPIYGQLQFTLNALDSLFALHSKVRAEIIIIDDRSPDESGVWLPQVKDIRYHLQPKNGGFIVSCNTGAAMARGKYVLMLNNDVRVLPGFLDELVEAFTLFPRAGLVGSKLLNDDGSLQEAGGILWRDGSAWNLGRGDDPNRPAWCHARQVDFISGCAIMLPRELWDRLDGFAPELMPAYAEDSELAIRVRHHGYETWLQPASRIIHYEGKTSGRDITKGVKAYQVVNSRKVFRKWRDALATHRPNGVDPMLERERNVTRRALVVDAVVPTPTQDAGSVTVVQTLQLYQALGYKTHFVPQDNFLFDPDNTPRLHRMGVETAYAPFNVDFERYVASIAPYLSVVQVYRFGVLERTLPALRKHAPNTPIIFHIIDLHYLRMEREAALTGNAELLERAAEVKKTELGLLSEVDCVITHSTHEQKLLNAEIPELPVVVWPFMFDVQGTDRGFDDRSGYAFLGGYRHDPNVDAVKYFCAEILPRIRKKQPKAVFYIAGANPPPEVQALASRNVIVTGMIEDLREVLDKARVFVCPLRIGAGVKGKISVAMAYGLPVVTTSVGSEGIPVENNQDLIVTDETAKFAEAALKVHEDPKLWARMSAAGMRLVEERHSLAMGRRILEEAIGMAFDHMYMPRRKPAPVVIDAPEPPVELPEAAEASSSGPKPAPAKARGKAKAAAAPEAPEAAPPPAKPAAKREAKRPTAPSAPTKRPR